MRFGNLPLLHQLAEEYNTAVNHALSSYVPKDLCSFEDDCDTTVDSTIIDGDHDDRNDNDLEYELEEIEDEIMMVLSSGSNKRRIELPENKRRKKRKKYDMKKLHFTNPITMERSIFTFEYSIWYCNYISELSPERFKWSKSFRNKFRMPYSSFLDLALQCEESVLFERWSSTQSIHKYNKNTTIPIKLLLL